MSQMQVNRGKKTARVDVELAAESGADDDHDRADASQKYQASLGRAAAELETSIKDGTLPVRLARAAHSHGE